MTEHVDGTQKRRCSVCLAEETPDNPVNVKCDGEDGDFVWLCLDGQACEARVLEQIEAAEVSCVP